MNAAAALAALRRLDVPAFTTADARALFGETTAAASKTLSRLATAGLVTSLARGLWTLDENVDPLLLPELLTSPSPSYVSLQTALYRRGVIEQIPAAIYAVSLKHTETIATKLGTFSIHQVVPEMFGGFETLANGVKLATSEKAVVDFLYLSSARSRLFAALPEIELAASFDADEARRWLRKIPSTRLRSVAEARFAAWVEPHLPRKRRRSKRRTARRR